MPDESAPAKPSAVEVFKTDSDYLKGDIPEELNDGDRHGFVVVIDFVLGL